MKCCSRLTQSASAVVPLLGKDKYREILFCVALYLKVSMKFTNHSKQDIFFRYGTVCKMCVSIFSSQEIKN